MDVDVHGLKKGGVRGGGGKVSKEGACMCKEFSQACLEVSRQCNYSILSRYTNMTLLCIHYTL